MTIIDLDVLLENLIGATLFVIPVIYGVTYLIVDYIKERKRS